MSRLYIYQFDPLLLDWKRLSDESETAPASRSDFSFTASNGTAYVFGGYFDLGTKKAENIFYVYLYGSPLPLMVNF